MNGEAGNVKSDNYQNQIKDKEMETNNFDRNNITNMDKKGFFCEMLPTKTLSASAKINRSKQRMKRITFVFCTNMDGTDKYMLSMIEYSRNSFLGTIF